MDYELHCDLQGSFGLYLVFGAEFEAAVGGPDTRGGTVDKTRGSTTFDGVQFRSRHVDL